MAWEDQGLFFTLILNGVVMTVVILVGYMLHKSESNHRVLRPRRPQSVMGSFWQFPKSLFTLNEDEVGASVGVEGAIYCLLLKFCAGFMLACCLGSLIIVSICATDSYLNDFLEEFDPIECRDNGNDQAACEDSPFCEWSMMSVANGTFNDTLFTACSPKLREGLYDFSVQNLTPKYWTMWLYAIACLASAIQMAIVLHYLLEALKRIFTKAYVQPILVPDNFDEKPASAAGVKLAADGPAKSYSALATVGARTVMVTGFFDGDDEDDEKILQDPAAVLKALKESVFPFGMVKKHAQAARKDSENKKMKPETKAKNADARAAEHAKDVKPDPAADFVDFIAPDSVVAMRQPPKKMLDLMAEEKAALDSLRNDVAAEQLEEEPEKNLPHKKRVPPICCRAVPAIPYDEEQVEKVREDLQPLVDEVPNQPFVGSVIFTFDTPLHALEYLETFNKAHSGFFSKRSAVMVGPKQGVIWDNLSTSTQGAASNLRWIVLFGILTLCTFFWGIPVAFLGSLDNLATLPVIGGPFATFVDVVPTTIRGIISAYLPTIILTLINIFLPAMMRGFSRIGGVQSLGAEDTTVLTLFFFVLLMTGIVIQAAIQGGLGQLAALISNPTQDSIFAFILAIVSPSGGYWFSYLITAACLGTFLKLLLLAPLIMSKVFVKAKLVGHQEAYDGLFAPRVSDYPIFLGMHLFFFAIGMLFHSTVPFLVPFGLLYFCNAYLVERALLLDGGKPQTSLNADFTLAKDFLGIALWIHTVASMGTVIVSVMKLHVPATVIAVFALAVSVGMQIRMRTQLNPLIKPSVKLYHQLVASSPEVVAGDGDDTAAQTNPQVADHHQTDVTPTDITMTEADAPPGPAVGELEPSSANEHGYHPLYAYYTVDGEAIDKIKGVKDYSIDIQWYHQNGSDAEMISFGGHEEEEEEAHAAEKKDKNDGVSSAVEVPKEASSEPISN